MHFLIIWIYHALCILPWCLIFSLSLTCCPATASLYWFHNLVSGIFLILLMTSELKLFLFLPYSILLFSTDSLRDVTQARWNNLASHSTSRSFFLMALGFIRKFSELIWLTDPAENFFFNGFVFKSELDYSQKSPIVQFTSMPGEAKQQAHWAANDENQRKEWIKVQPLPSLPLVMANHCVSSNCFLLFHPWVKLLHFSFNLFSIKRLDPERQSCHISVRNILKINVQAHAV